MKKLLSVLFTISIGISTVSAQNKMQKTAVSSENTSISKDATEGNSNVKIAGSGEAIVMPSSNMENASGVNKIPDGMYGSNRSGNVYSTSNPNYPYDKKGKLIQSKNSRIVKSKGLKSTYRGSSSVMVNSNNPSAPTSATTTPPTKSAEPSAKK